MRLGFQHTYLALPSRFYARVDPTPVADPRVVAFNGNLAAELRLDPQLTGEAAAVLSGNTLPQDAVPLAMAYAGHQFGAFVPQLGDGRAILLGELPAADGILYDLQLKGAGPTPFSRSGDGRAALGPMLREYLISEAMHALRIPTTRSLAVISTGERVFREDVLPGAVLTRVAASHVRVGTFQYFAARDDQPALQILLDYVIARHYPSARAGALPALAVLEAVVQRQAALVADWMLVGFIHGVMNTDNMAISGETIDYGPCAFMDKYDPRTVFSSIDHGGRYAYANQAAIAQWNLARFAETLLKLIDADPQKAVALATPVVEGFIEQFETRFLDGMRCKLGLSSELDGDAALAKRLLAAMHESGSDFTLTFRRLADAAESPGQRARLSELFTPASEIDTWMRDWQERLQHDPQTLSERVARMRAKSPAYIPRNHRVEAALAAASERGDYVPFHELLAVLQRPFDEQPQAREYSQPPEPSERVFQTFCGT